MLSRYIITTSLPFKSNPNPSSMSGFMEEVHFLMNEATGCPPKAAFLIRLRTRNVWSRPA